MSPGEADLRPVEHIHYLQSMDRVNEIMRAAPDLETLMSDVLGALLEILDCERAWLLYPCDPEVDRWRVPMERTREGWPGALAQGVEIPLDELTAQLFRDALASPTALRFGPAHDRQVPKEVAELFTIHSQLTLAIRPKTGAPWMFGIHHCRAPRTYGEHDVRVFDGIGQRLADSLGTWLSLQELRKSEARFRDLVHYAPEAILLLDTTTRRFSAANPNALELFGRSLEQLLETDLLELGAVRQSDGAPAGPKVEDALRRALRGLTPAFEWTLAHPEGEEIPCEVRLIRFPDPEHEMVRCTVTDIRERKALEEQLRESQKLEAVGLLVGGVAHDFNNLLTAIVGNGELALRDHASEELETMLEAAWQAASLIDQLLAFSRKTVRQSQLVDLNEVVSDSDRLLSRVLGARVSVDVALGADPAIVWAHPARLQQVIINLAINARDAMPDGGTLRLETANPGQSPLSASENSSRQWVTLVVSDTGTGIDPAMLERIFTPFFTSKPEGRGTGLGLPTIRASVREFGGSIEVTSRVGEGSSFTVWLPVAPEEFVREDVTETGRVPGGTERVLLVEDVPGVRTVIAKVLRESGYTVFAADGVSSAQRLWGARRDDVGLVVTDLVLPDGSGERLVDTLREDRPDLPALYMSGFSPDDAILEAARAGQVAFLAKPFRGEELLRSVRRQLDGAI